MVRKADRYTLTGGAGAGSRTSVIVFSAAQPHRLGVLVVASHVLYSRGKVSRRPWSLTGYPEPSKPLVRASVSGERASTCRSGIESPADHPAMRPSPAYEISSFDRCYLITAFVIPVATNPKRAPQITLTTMPPIRPAVSSNGIEAVSSGLHVKNVCRKTPIATPITA
jgi:hypothetical protein